MAERGVSNSEAVGSIPSIRSSYEIPSRNYHYLHYDRRSRCCRSGLCAMELDSGYREIPFLLFCSGDDCSVLAFTQSVPKIKIINSHF
jgi:hypothetical protein